MELLLDVPSFLHPLLQWLSLWIVTLQDVWMHYIHDPWAQLNGALQNWFFVQNASVDHETTSSSKSSVFLSILALTMFFWPVVLSVLVAIMSAGTWIIWLATSILLGLLQFCFATYHFAMIAIDICSLSLLKTYAVMRSQVLFYMDSWTTTTTTNHASTDHSNNNSNNGTSSSSVLVNGSGSGGSSKSRRRHWRSCLEQAGTYENFLKIRITPKNEQKMKFHQNTVDSALPPPITRMVRTASFPERSSAAMLVEPQVSSVSEGGGDNASDAAWTTTTPPRRGTGLYRRTRSFTGGTPTTSGSASRDDTTSNHSPSLTPFSFANPSSPPSSPRSSPPPSLSPSTMAGMISMDERVQEELGEKTAHLLVTTTERLEEARRAVQTDPTEENAKALKYLLASVVKRNHLTLDDIWVENSRSIAVTGEYGLTAQTRQVLRAYYEQVEQGLDWLAEAPMVEPAANPGGTAMTTASTASGNSSSRNNNNNQLQTNSMSNGNHTATSSSNNSQNNINYKEDSNNNNDSVPALPLPSFRPFSSPNEELLDRVTLVRKMKQNMGRTALMLSGGGAQAMYHAGLLRALIESKLYKDISVVSGTSGGSIMAAMCAIKTDEELLNYVCVPNVSTDFMSDGKMKEQNIRWFPKPLEMASYWLKNKLLVDSDEFRRTCEFYYSDITFEEAFERTGKHVCINVSASRASGNTAQRLLLNHISTPHVTVASAVAASCALPGVMAPTKLISKNSNGFLEPFLVDGVEWIDGSVQADLPFQRISTLFAVSSFIVSQTNFHIVPFLNKAHHPSEKSLYWRLFQTIEWDIRSRALKLSRLGLFPHVFGQDISKVFKQRYHGNLTIVPRFTTMQTLGLHVLANPTVTDMKGYLKYGQISAWPHLNAIRYMIRLERALDDCLHRLEDRLRSQHSSDPEWSFHDEVDSIASSSAVAVSNMSHRVRIVGRPGNLSSRGGDASTACQSATAAEQQQQRQLVHNLQEENLHLKKELEHLKSLLGEKGDNKKNTSIGGGGGGGGGEQRKSALKSSPVSDGNEGHLWNLILGKRQQN